MTPATTSSIAPRPKLREMFLVLLAMLLISKIPPTTANYEHYCNGDSYLTEPQGVCGNALVDRVRLMCDYILFGSFDKYVVKRSVPSDTNRELNNMLMTKKDAMSFLSKRQSGHNIVCECCIHSCGPRELFQYCEVPNFRRVRSAMIPKSKIDK